MDEGWPVHYTFASYPLGVKTRALGGKKDMSRGMGPRDGPKRKMMIERKTLKRD